MARTHLYHLSLILCSVISLVSSLKLQYQATAKPRYTIYSSSTLAPGANGALAAAVASPAVTEATGISFYRVNDSKGSTCILIKTDALIEINWKSNIGDETGDTYLPDNPLVEGECNDDESSMTITWNGYSLVWSFSKTPGGERWYISNMELRVSTDLPKYHNIRIHGNVIKLYHEKMLIPTPVGKSYSCEETVIELTPKQGDSAPDGLSGTLFLRAFQVQPFMYKGANFQPAVDCTAAKNFVDETAPIAVGSTLAIAVLLTVTGYGIFRYFKVKKVQYNTME